MQRPLRILIAVLGICAWAAVGFALATVLAMWLGGTFGTSKHILPTHLRWLDWVVYSPTFVLPAAWFFVALKADGEKHSKRETEAFQHHAGG